MFHGQIRAAGALTVWALAAWCAAGCGGDNEESHKRDVATFIGTWAVTNGGLTGACPPLVLPPQPVQPGETLSLVAGSDSDLVLEREACQVKLDVAGNTATARPGQSCPVSIPFSIANLPPAAGAAPISITLNIAKGVFVAMGATGTYDQTGGITLPIPVVSTCTYGIAIAARKNP
jgi:hypothetical protein